MQHFIVVEGDKSVGTARAFLRDLVLDQNTENRSWRSGGNLVFLRAITLPEDAKRFARILRGRHDASLWHGDDHQRSWRNLFPAEEKCVNTTAPVGGYVGIVHYPDPSYIVAENEAAASRIFRRILDRDHIALPEWQEVLFQQLRRLTPEVGDRYALAVDTDPSKVIASLLQRGDIVLPPPTHHILPAKKAAA